MYISIKEYSLPPEKKEYKCSNCADTGYTIFYGEGLSKSPCPFCDANEKKEFLNS